MSDRCNKSKKLSAQKAKYRRCHTVVSDSNSAIARNQMASSMQQFCIDSNIMLNSLRKCSLTESHKRRRRFHPLRNLRRIFRRRTLAHADAIRPIVQQHQNYYHRNEAGNQQYPNDLTNVSTIRSLSAQSIDDDVLPDDLSDFQSSHLIRSTNQSNLLAATKRAYYYTKDGGTGKRLNHPGVMDLDTETDTDLTREMIDYQRSLSEGRLLDNDFSRETLSHSHDSVFSESATASSLSIVLKAELADALRKRKSRSDASDEDLGLPRSPSTPPRNGGHHVVDGQINSTNAARHQHHSSLGLLSMASSEIYDDSMESSSFLSTSKSSYEIGKHDTSDDMFPEISLNSSRDSETRLSHSAAKHKMAIRPKKKGPSRLPRKPTDTSNALPPMPEVNEDFFKSSNVIDSLVNKSQSLPRGVTNITTTKTIEKHSNMSTTLNKQTKSKFGKTIYTSSEFDGKDQKDAIDTNHRSTISSMTKSSETRTLETKREERTHSEEGFFRRFINRSGRKQKKDRDTNTPETDAVDANKPVVKKMETSTPAIKKSAELSILNVLSNARANEKPIGSKAPLINYMSSEELDGSPKSLIMKGDKLRSGPIARQRYTKDITQAVIDSEKMHSSELMESHSPKKQSPATSYLRFSPTKSIVSQCDDDSDKFVRTSHYRSEEMLNTTSSTVCDSIAFDEDSVSLPKNAYPSESNKFTSNTSRNGYGWGQCQQKISKMASDQQQGQVKSQTKGKMVEKSKSFRLYTKNFNNETITQTRNECKSTLCPSLPDLNAPNRSPLARPSRYHTSNRESLQSHRYLNSSGNHLNANAETNTKWTPTRSSSSSRISEHRFGNNRFEINDMNLIPTSKLYSTLNTSDEIASYDIENDAHLAGNETNSNVLQVSSSKSHHYNQNPNINEIEDNIDKIMKSSVVTVLKKSPTAEMYQIKTNGNVSLTTITSNDESEGNGLNMATVENPPLLRHSTTAKLDLQVPSSSSPPKKIVSEIPEFMQIQLNRVDASRPKSCIEYSSSPASNTSNNNATTTNAPNEEDKERRFSNESIEISDKKKVAISSSAMNIYNPNLNKSSESLKSGFGRQSRASIGSQPLSRGSSTSDINKTSIVSDNHSSDDCLDIDLDDDNDGHIVIERRKSVSDKKLKFEQQIEKIQAEVKRSSIIGSDKNIANPRKLSLEDDSSSSGVILRGKKSAKSSDSNDPTPELMKVFARRSLKIKDTDEYQVHDDAERDALNQKMQESVNNDTNNNLNRINNAKNSNRFNTDSDKENHVSSGAQSSIPKVEIYIKPNKEMHEKCDGSPKKEAAKNNVDMSSVKSIGKMFNNTGANRFSSNPSNPTGTHNYRNSSAFFEHLNHTSNSPIRTNPKPANDSQSLQDNGVVLIIEKNPTNNNDNINNKFNSNAYNNNFTKNTTPIISNKIGQIQTSINRTSTVNANTNANANANANEETTTKTTAAVSNNSDSSVGSQDIEYKGILERKAEWEKRASQAFK